MITFEIEQTKEEKKKNKLTRKLFGKDLAQKIIIRKDGNIVGHIFSPSGSGNDIDNAIQVCGFTEAFDLWGCGIFKGFKDIQLLFDEGVMGGVDTHKIEDCLRCYRRPCQCENNKSEHIPFKVKAHYQLDERLKITSLKEGKK